MPGAHGPATAPGPTLPTARPEPAPPACGSAAGGSPRIGLVTLGCDKNTVDSERILGRLAAAGAAVSAEAAGADVVVINTCGFIDVAKEESVEAILEAARLKEEGRVRAVVAVGCLVQRYKAELSAELPEVDLFLGLTEMERLVPELRQRGLLGESAVPTMERPLRVLGTGTRHTAHLKVSEGCDHSCAFCAIPLMRGKHRSTPIPALLREARELERRGVVELNLISQDTTWYGRDLVRGAAAAAGDLFVGKPFPGMAGITASGAPATGRNGARGGEHRRGVGAPRRAGLLPDLLRALLSGTSVPWLRLFYMYPSGITRELVGLMAAEPRIVPYLDMPIQHGSDPVLERMRRPERRSTIRERVAWLRDAIPDLALRTTVIVGFPGESEGDFEAMLELLEEIRFDHLGAFAYSPEEGTRAIAMPDPVPAAVARERLERLLDLQRSISLERNEARIGGIVTVLVDEIDEHGGAVGRTAGQALEIDGVVRLAASGAVPEVRPGTFVRAHVVGGDDRDLDAVMLGVVR